MSDVPADEIIQHPDLAGALRNRVGLAAENKVSDRELPRFPLG
jgi:hypothetical protein